VSDRPDYQRKKAFFDSLLTIYGRKPVLEVLLDPTVPVFRLHLADSNKPGGIIAEIEAAARARAIDILRHDKQALSRISRNGREDQGVAADLQLPRYRSLTQWLEETSLHAGLRLLALDRVTNPQNLGMLIRSACAGGVDGVLIPRQGCAPLSPLVIKASAGTLFRCPLLRCDELAPALRTLQDRGFTVATLSSHAEQSLFDWRMPGARVYVLGNETDGVSAAVSALADQQIRIPMANGVESLNVAVTAALIAYYGAAQNR
jgi:23S rRNA (guanosine2251-2'-O)-methyltransferase